MAEREKFPEMELYVKLRKAGEFKNIPWGHHIGVSISRVVLTAPTREELFKLIRDSHTSLDEPFFLKRRGFPPKRVDLPTIFLD